MLYKGGIPVRVPSPERYAVHKLIVAVMRRVDPAKSDKDIRQSEQLIEALLPRRNFSLFEAWEEACARGPSWREHLLRGREMLDQSIKDRFIFTLQTHGWAEKRLTKKQPKKASTSKSEAKIKNKSESTLKPTPKKRKKK